MGCESGIVLVGGGGGCGGSGGGRIRQTTIAGRRSDDDTGGGQFAPTYMFTSTAGLRHPSLSIMGENTAATLQHTNSIVLQGGSVLSVKSDVSWAIFVFLFF